MAIEPISEEGASRLAERIIVKINELIGWITNHQKADSAWKIEAEGRLKSLEQDVKNLKAENRGLKIAKGKAKAGREKAIAGQQRAESILEEARRLLN